MIALMGVATVTGGVSNAQEIADMLKAQGKSVSKRMLTGCLKRQHNLEAKLQKIQYRCV